MAHDHTDAGAQIIQDNAPTDITLQTEKPSRPMHRFLQGWRVITRHPELDAVRKQELRWDQSLDGKPS
jgi:hypothetical protein